MSILFILKAHLCSGGFGDGTSASGLRNSATLIADMLNQHGTAAKVVTVIDGNGIDKEVHDYRPDIVILEAIWCPPDKLQELAKLWPGIRWIVRIHSEIPFLANEGQALDWLFLYKAIPNVRIAANASRANSDLAVLNPVYLPNYYPITESSTSFPHPSQLHVGCFGAVRPLKNQLAQAFAAIHYAIVARKALYFYMNSIRTEQGGENPLKNIRALFANYPQFHLVEVGWLDEADFLLLVKQMDVCMSVSLTETFCITAANAVTQNIPVVVSPEISWTDPLIQADPTNISDIVRKLGVALGRWRAIAIKQNLIGLENYNQISVSKWLGLR